jgi:hypothetical protein
MKEMQSQMSADEAHDIMEDLADALDDQREVNSILGQVR